MVIRSRLAALAFLVAGCNAILGADEFKRAQEGCKVASDCPVEVGGCTSATCTAGVCGTTPKAGGADCSSGGKRCDGAGSCVVCRIDGQANDAETDVDCGGPDCGPCADEQLCSTTTDCMSGVCQARFCSPATCIDGVKNGTESDVDCGGGCGSDCLQGGRCLVDDDCVTKHCSDMTCCGVSCDGPCRRCDNQLGGCRFITAGEDAEPEECPGRANTCDGTGECTECHDSTQDGAETDIDCGGPTCKPCGNGGACVVDEDCVTCVCRNGMCGGAECNDAKRGACESDVDCGGPCGATCGGGQSCRTKSDCASGSCVDAHCEGP